MIAYLNAPPDWHFNKNFHLWQKTSGRYYCYISTHGEKGYTLQLYKRGRISLDTSVCELEFRHNIPRDLFMIGEHWLKTYAEADIKEVRKHYYSVENPVGYWRTGRVEERSPF